MSSKHLDRITRRQCLQLAATGVVGYSGSGWMQTLAASAAERPERRMACILLWMDGGPAQTDTFDLKPGHPNGGLFRPIATRVPGIQISEHLPRIARLMDKMAILRSMNTGADDHPPGAYLLHSGYPQRGPIQHPTLGSIVAREIGPSDAALPNFVSIAPQRSVSPGAYDAGFLGPRYAPLLIGEGQQSSRNIDSVLRVPDLAPWAGVSGRRFDTRVDLLRDLDTDFAQQRPGVAVQSHQTAYQSAVTLTRTTTQRVFHLETEPSRVRDAYGRNLFGQGCLLARRLVEQGVPFVEVTLSNQPGHANWDTHGNNFATVRSLSAVLDTAWAALMEDLAARGLLDSTLIVWAGEFGRTPQLPRGRDGRDHWTNGWSTVLAGGGIRGGQVIGRTSADGVRIEERPISPAVFLATITKALGIDPSKMIMSNTGRPIPIAEDSARPIAELLS